MPSLACDSLQISQVLYEINSQNYGSYSLLFASQDSSSETLQDLKLFIFSESFSELNFSELYLYDLAIRQALIFHNKNKKTLRRISSRSKGLNLAHAYMVWHFHKHVSVRYFNPFRKCRLSCISYSFYCHSFVFCHLLEIEFPIKAVTLIRESVIQNYNSTKVIFRREHCNTTISLVYFIL